MINQPRNIPGFSCIIPDYASLRRRWMNHESKLCPFANVTLTKNEEVEMRIPVSTMQHASASQRKEDFGNLECQHQAM
jgi:hypothetical protein